MSVTVVYEIASPLRALTMTDDIIDTIGDMAQRAVKAVVSQCSIEELKTGKRPNKQSVDAVLASKIRLDVEEYGVRVVGAFLADIAVPQMVHLISNHSHTV